MKIKTFALFLLSLLLMGGCRQKPKSFWASDDPSVDALMDTLDSKFNGDAELDELNIWVARLDSLAKISGNKESKARAAYWHGKLAMAISEPSEARPYLNEAMELCDSVRYPYDYRIFALLGVNTKAPEDSLYRFIPIVWKFS